MTLDGAAFTFGLDVKTLSVKRANYYDAPGRDAAAKHARARMCHMCLWSPEGGGARVT